MLIDKEKLKDIIPVVAAKHKFRPAIVEKDYYLTVILNNIGAGLSDEIAFKGGTLLNKIHLNYHRLSEDLDFVYCGSKALATRAQRSAAIQPIRERMPEFLRTLGLKSDNVRGRGFNESTQYVFIINYDSSVTAREGEIKIEISLRHKPMEKPTDNPIKHFYQDPFTGADLIPKNAILSLSLNEAVAEKLKAAINREEAAIRDYYDLWHIAGSGFDFFLDSFIRLFKKKLAAEDYQGDYRHNFGLAQEQTAVLRRQIETDLRPVIRFDEGFDLDAVFVRFDRILSDKRYVYHI